MIQSILSTAGGDLYGVATQVPAMPHAIYHKTANARVARTGPPPLTVFSWVGAQFIIVYYLDY